MRNSIFRFLTTFTQEQLRTQLNQIKKAAAQQNFRAVLGITNPNASEDEIKKSYRTLAQKFHPDNNPEFKSLTTELMKEINNAFDQIKTKAGTTWSDEENLAAAWKEYWEEGWKEDWKDFFRQKRNETQSEEVKAKIAERKREFDHLIERIACNDVTLTDIKPELDRIDYINPTPSFTDEDIISLAKAMEENTTIKKLNLTRFVLNDYLPKKAETVCAIAEMIRLNKGLEELDLESATNHTFSKVAEALKENNSLKKFSCRCAESSLLIKSLKENRTLKDLDIGIDDLSPDLIDNVAELIEQNTSLENLSLRALNFYHINSESINRLTQAWKKNTSLKTFGFTPSFISNQEHFNSFIAALGKSPSLTSLWIGLSDFKDPYADAISDLIRTNDKIENINLTYCRHITTHGMKAIVEALENNYTVKTISVETFKSQENNEESALKKRIQELTERNRNLADEKISRPSTSPTNIPHSTKNTASSTWQPWR